MPMPHTNGRTIITSLAILLNIALAVSPVNISFAQTAPLQTPRFEEVTSSDSDFSVSVPKAYSSRRGYLIVKESPNSHSDREISLPVVIIKSKQKANTKQQPPILKLAGGPGVSGLNTAAYPGAYPWLSHRDFIIMGQRGTKHAKPALMCPEFLRALNAANNNSELSIAAAKKCRQRYQSAGIDLSAYHSSASARDIEALRIALNIDKFALYGGSYGTRLALTYARDYPDSVASMVLDSPLPHTARFDDQSPQNFEHALQAIADSCLSMRDCRNAFPRLFERFKRALASAADTPWNVQFKGGTQRDVSDTQLAILMNPSSPSSAAYIPITMDAIARKDIQSLAPLLDSESATTAFAWGMRLSVWCSESAPFSQRYTRKPPDSFASLDGAAVAPEVCKIWRVPKRPMQEKVATTASVPTLVIAGQFDHLTPPSWGEEVVSTLNNSYLAIIPHGGHLETNNWSGNGCAMKIAATFFKDEQAFLKNPLAASTCLNNPPAIKFVIDKTAVLGVLKPIN